MSASQRLLYLIRHGATEANLRRPYVLQGRRRDLPLSEIGRRQAEAVRQVLQERPIDFIFSSPLRRAMETAQLLAQPHLKPVQTVPDLTECDVGRWEGLSWDEIRQQDRQAWEAFEADPGMAPYAAGESFQQVQGRVVPAIEQLLRDHPEGSLIVVTHNIVGRVYVAHVLGLPISKARNIRQDNGGLTVISTAGGTTKVLTLNAVFHLDGLLVD